MLVPEAAELRDPGVGLTERASVDGIDTARSLDADVNEAAFTQRAEVLGDGGLGDSEFAPDDLREAAGALLAAGQQFQDAAADGISENIESVRGGHGRSALASIERGGASGGFPGGLLRIHRCFRFEITAEAEDGEIPANADCAGSKLIPQFFGDIRNVFEPPLCAAVGERGEADVQPADLTAEFPGDIESARRIACGDLAAGVAVELITAAEAEIARDQEEPTRDAVRIGDGVPEVFGTGVVGAGGGDDAGRAPLVVTGFETSSDGADVTENIKFGQGNDLLRPIVSGLLYISEYLNNELWKRDDGPIRGVP